MAVPNVNGQPIVPLTAGQHQIGDQVLQPGGPAATVGGSTVQVDPQGTPVVNGNPVQQAAPVTTTADGHVVVNDGSGGVRIDGVQIPAGTGAPKIVGGTPAWVPEVTPQANAGQAPGQAPGLQIPANMAPAVTTLPGGQAVQNNNGEIQVNNQPLQAGGPPVVVSGATYSLDPSNGVHIGTQVFSAPTIAPVPSTVIAGQNVVPVPSGVVVGGQTLRPGGAAITLSNSVPVSLGTSFLVVGSSTVPVNQAPTPAAPIIHIGDKALTQAPGGIGYVIGGSTLLPGAPAITIGGTPYSLAPSQSALIAGTSTVPLAVLASDPTQKTAATPAQVAGGQTFTPLNPSQAVVGSKTLLVGGPAITGKDGQIVSLATGGLLVGSSTFAFPTPTTSPSNSTSAGTTGKPQAYLGAAAHARTELSIAGWYLAIGLSAVALVCLL